MILLLFSLLSFITGASEPGRTPSGADLVFVGDAMQHQASSTPRLRRDAHAAEATTIPTASPTSPRPLRRPTMRCAISRCLWAAVKVNDFSVREELGSTDKFPRWAIAYKFEAEETTTVVRDVVWQIGRTGKLTPLALFDGVELSGATIRRATLNNYGDMQRKGVKVGSRVLIRRSNDVIPEILGTTETHETDREVEKPTVCPYCGDILEEIGANLFCKNAECRIANRIMEITPSGLIDKITTYDEYLDSDELARKRQILSVQDDED